MMYLEIPPKTITKFHEAFDIIADRLRTNPEYYKIFKQTIESNPDPDTLINVLFLQERL